MARLTSELSAQFVESRKLEQQLRKNLEELGWRIDV